MDWISKQLQNLLLLIAVIASLFSVISIWIKGKVYAYKANKEIKEKHKDLVIASEPNKSKRDLLKWMRRK